jgi:putative transposase
LIKNHNKRTSKKLQTLTLKRNNKIKWSLHNYSKYIINYAIKNNVSEIAIGYNKFWKQKVNLGVETNQSFTQIPFDTFLKQLKYKAELNGISILLNEESYTSKCSALDLEPIQKHKEYKGKRVERGLFQTANNLIINADQNGSMNIGRKVFGNDFIKFNTGCVVHPVKVTPL